MGYAGIATADAWAVGFFAWLPCLVCLAVAAAVAAHLFGGMKLPSVGEVGPWLALGLLSALAVFILAIRTITLIAQSGNGAGTEWGLYVALVVSVVQLRLAYALVKQHGEKIPALPRH